MIKKLLYKLGFRGEELDKKQLRIYEIIPGSLVWATFIICIGLSFLAPIWAIYLIIVLDVYWVIRIWYLFAYLIASFVNYQKAKKTDWKAKLLKLDNWEKYIHLVSLPTYKEPYEVVKATIQKLVDVDYPKDKIIIVLGGEERDENNFNSIAERIKIDFGDKFFDFITTLHPKDLPDEIPGKGSNMHYIGRYMANYFKEKNIDYDKVIISMFDIETWAHPQYFNCLTYKYLTVDNPEHYSYQPLILFNNNIWKTNPLVRVAAHSTTFWLLTDLSRVERLFTFSSHSMSFKTLVEVGFHPKDVVTEDTRIFLHCLNYFNGDYKVCPIFIPLSMQTVDTGNFWESLKNQYIQIRRWGWGVEHFPWMMRNLIPNKNISRKVKLKYLWNQSEGVYTWATLPILITILGYLPIKVADLTIHYSVVIHNAPILLEQIMNTGMVGILTSSAMNLFFLPKKPKSVHPVQYLVVVAQWILFPLTMIIFGSIPSAEAQTRLMFGGKYRLGFQVTKKV